MPNRRRHVATNQLDLITDLAPADGWWHCRGVFTRPNLRDRLFRSEHVPSADEVRPLFERIRARWVDNLAGLRRQNESYTRTRFLDPSLTDLGWHFIPEQNLPYGHTRKRPDYCLFGDQETERRVAAGNSLEIFRSSLTVIEAKKVGISLDEEVTDRETPGWFPSQQIQDYLRWATDSSGQRFFRWGVLSNGQEWRLYSIDAAPDAYFAFHLAHEEHFCDLEDFRLFVALFRPLAFDRDADERCLLDAVREESLTQQVELERDLRKRIFDVLEELAEGYFNNAENHLTRSDLKEVYDTCLIFLYRLLFVLYAESRGMLPAKISGPGSNARYRREFSLTRLVEKLRDRNTYLDDAFDGLYRELLKLFRLINGSSRVQNERLSVTSYNGGLFNPDYHPNIEGWWVGEKTLANVLRQLIFAQPPSRGRTRQQVINTAETLDYGTLEVRQLGDIYEGLLGGHLQVTDRNRLELINERGVNKRQGIFYTPDWVVNYLVGETLRPLLAEIENTPQVIQALQAKSLERRCNNSFALGVLRLNILDPAMGSGHFLVRATEFLAREIKNHLTTRTMTERVVDGGNNRRTRSQILADGRIPIPPGVSQEQAEIAYWRRRVVESCIYGVDSNPLASELTKLSLWLTCIAIDEPLNFLDHHIRCGNSLLAANPEDLHRLPFQSNQATFSIGEQLTTALGDAIQQIMSIESEASTEMEIVKNKENCWRQVCSQLQPYKDIANLWMAALDGLVLNDFEYRDLVLAAISPRTLSPEEKRNSKRVRERIAQELLTKTGNLQPYHWHLEFPSVFYDTQGQLVPKSQRGFDVVLGNPPYISTQTSSEQRYRSAVEKSFGYLDDLYVHFTELGFSLLRHGGRSGLIVSDTFFTLTSKLRMRELLQRNVIYRLGQCNPFEATVDAAIFVAEKRDPPDHDALLFIQARYGTDTRRPEIDLPKLPEPSHLSFRDKDTELDVRHDSFGSLRLHDLPARVYRKAYKRAFFEPLPAALELFKRFNDAIVRLTDDWWNKIDTSSKFSANIAEIREYHTKLKRHDVTLVGLIADGAQGMRTGDNGRFLGYLSGTPQADRICEKREEWTSSWMAEPRIREVFLNLLVENGGNPRHPTSNATAWECCIEPLKAQFHSSRDLRFGRSDLYRVVPSELIATNDDFLFAWRRRKTDLLNHWQNESSLREFWEQRDLLRRSNQSREELRNAQDVTDEAFCKLCCDILAWWEHDNYKGRTAGEPQLPRSVIGLKPSEVYASPEDSPRIATIYNGLSGRGQWVPFRKGDPEGDRWVDNEPLYIRWTEESVNWLSTATEARWQGHRFFFTPGVTWSLHANHTSVKARYQEPCVFDASGSRLTPVRGTIPTRAFLAIMNSNVFSFFLKKFIKHNQDVEINDLRNMPLVVPTKKEAETLVDLTKNVVSAKRLTFRGELPANDLVAYTRRWSAKLVASGPRYLHPPAQHQLLSTAESCLCILELAVNWEVEKLYGVEGRGPFDEF